MAYTSTADILGYGGQAGGGKSDLILGTAITRHRRSIIFRREAKQGRSLIDRSRDLLSGMGRFNENSGVWSGLPEGRKLEFAGVKDPNDVLNWRGQPHDFIGIDEADTFLESQVRFLLGWLRTTIPGQRCRAILGFNPPACPEGRWLIDYFGPWVDRKHPRPAMPGELRWYAMMPDGKGGMKEVEVADGSLFEHQGDTVRPRSRTFVPASVRDNPDLMATDYLSQLLSLPEPLRSQLAYGDFAAGLKDDPYQVIPTAWVEEAMARWTPQGRQDRMLAAVGIDVARGGDAQTVFAKRYANWFAPLIKHPGRTTPDGNSVANLLSFEIRENPLALLNIDVIGVGSSPYDHCRDRRYNAHPINFANRTDGTDKTGILRMTNVRAYAYWSLRELLDPANGQEAMLPPDRELLGDLTAPRWSMAPGGVKIEAKEDIMERIGRSTDCGDAVALSILLPPPRDDGDTYTPIRV